MSLTLHFHPLSSYCHKALIALYENDTPFERRIVDLMDPAEARGVQEAMAVRPVSGAAGRRPDHPGVEHHHRVSRSALSGKTQVHPRRPRLARQVRFKDRFYDLQLHAHMQKIVGDRLRPEGKKDPHGVEERESAMTVALDMIDAEMAGRTWAMGDDFTLADCAAAPPLFYIRQVCLRCHGTQERGGLSSPSALRPSYARAIEEAQPYFKMFPDLTSRNAESVPC